jgi:2-phosphosulfolactate phosphatase
MADRKLHVILRKEDVDPARLADKVVVVIDTLFATTTIVHALSHGARSVTPALDGAEARSIAVRAQADAGAAPLLAGELNGQTLPGFSYPTPQALARVGVRGRDVVYSTTNGTVALRRSRGAHAVYAACLRNAAATVVDVLQRHPARTVILLCAGSGGSFNVEDFLTAGVLCRHFTSRNGGALLTDSAQAAIHCQSSDLAQALLSSRIGRKYAAQWRAEIEFAGQIDVEPTVAILNGDALVAAAGASAN